MERRFFNAQPVRIERVGTDPPTIVGYAAPFYAANDPGSEYQLYDDLVERIMPSAFDRALREDDVRALFNHDPNFILGRMLPGTLSLWTDPQGLRYAIRYPDTQHVRETVLAPIERGDVTGSSFSFSIHPDGANYRRDGKMYIRELTSVQLYDVGPVTFPAYKSSSTGARMVEDPAAVRKELEAWQAQELEQRLASYRQRAIAAGKGAGV